MGNPINKDLQIKTQLYKLPEKQIIKIAAVQETTHAHYYCVCEADLRKWNLRLEMWEEILWVFLNCCFPSLIYFLN